MAVVDGRPVLVGERKWRSEATGEDIGKTLLRACPPSARTRRSNAACSPRAFPRRREASSCASRRGCYRPSAWPAINVAGKAVSPQNCVNRSRTAIILPGPHERSAA